MSTTGTRTTGIRTRAVALIAGVALLTLSLGVGVVSANAGSENRDADNVFTKWITAYPAMAGFVGGDVGTGTYRGEAITMTVTDTGLNIDAWYHFNGSVHSFTARVLVVQTGFATGATAVITGQVTDGWLKGNQVEGQYTAITCDQSPAGCYQGTLDILRGTKSGE